MGNKRRANRNYCQRKRLYRGNQHYQDEEKGDLENSEPNEISNICNLEDSCSEESDVDDEEEQQSDSDISDDHELEDVVGRSGNRIVSIGELQALLSAGCVRAQCKAGGLVLQEVARHGLGPTFQLSCDSCNFQVCHEVGEKSKQGKFWDINRCSALASRLSGGGRESLAKMCGILNMPPPTASKNFQRYTKKLHAAAKSVAAECMKTAADELVEANGGGDGPKDCAVSTDGTWMRRGFASLYGVQTVISWNTGKVLDYEIQSKHCTQCTSKNSTLEKKEITQEAFDAWKVDHQPSCQVTTTGSSPAMEAESVKALWARSITQNRLRYTEYIRDGDSKGHATVADTYGPKTVVKEECVSHVQKRVGRSLRDLKQRLGKKQLADGKSIGGKGRLTDALTNSLQNYYGKAIRNHSGCVSEMARAIWASFCHKFSTDSKPDHRFCPEGKSSWCGYQQASADGKEKDYKHSGNLASAILDEVKPIYLRLTDRPLLERCVRGATQNANEALNRSIWHMCPKESFCGVEAVETAVCLAIIINNCGHAKLASVIERLDCEVGHFTSAELARLDASKTKYKARKASDSEKRPGGGAEQYGRGSRILLLNEKVSPMKLEDFRYFKI